MKDSPVPNRRRFICFAWLLLVVVITGTFLLVWIVRAQSQAAIVAEIQGAGGYVVYDYEVEWHSEDWRAFSLDPSDELPCPQWLHRLVGVDLFQRVRMVGLGKAVLHTDDIEALKSLPGLRSVSLHRYSTQDEVQLVQEALPNCLVEIAPSGP